MHRADTTIKVTFAFFVIALCLPTSASSDNSIVIDTQNLLPKIEAYYQAIDKQLNKRSSAVQRDPFNNTLANVQVPSPSTTNNTHQQFTKINARSLFSDPKENQDNGDIPGLSFKGLLQSKGKKLALLGVDGQGTFVVKEGDKVGIRQVGSSTAVLHILEINNLNLIVETGSYKEKMVVQ